MTRHLFSAVWKPFACGVSAALLALSLPVHAAEIPDDVGEKLLQGYISPAFEHFQQAAGALHGSLSGWCAKPDAAGTERVQSDFVRLATAWSQIEFLRFGPLIASGRFERIYFWPDPRGMTLRQVSGLLRSQNEIPDGAALGSHSVALQGLPALEYVLYDDEGLLARQAKDARACSYAASIAANLVSVSTELTQQWRAGGDYAQKFARPGVSNPLYRSKQEVAGEGIKALSSGLQFARDVKVMPVLGSGMPAAKPKRAPFWRSGLTAKTMAASVDGMLRFYKAAGLHFASDEEWMDTSLQHELIQARDTLSSMSGSIAPRLKSKDGYRELTLTTLLLKNAKSITDEHVAPALGVRIGFNALDGD
jgi:predicted lipoprotein